jgi:hypothetical protein
MFKIVPRKGTCDAGFSSSKFRSSCLPFVVNSSQAHYYDSDPTSCFSSSFILCADHRNITYQFSSTVDSRYLEFDGTMEKIWVNRSSTQEELRKYRKCSLFNHERQTTRAKFWRAKSSIACPYWRKTASWVRVIVMCLTRETCLPEDFFISNLKQHY